MMMGVPGEDRRLEPLGLSTCATCDGFFFRGQDIAVVGGGDSALEEALFLTRFASSVTIVHRRDTLRASKIMQQRAFANDKIHFAWNTQVVEVLGDDRVMGLKVRDTVTGDDHVMDVTGIFVAIGHVPNTTLSTISRPRGHGDATHRPRSGTTVDWSLRRGGRRRPTSDC